jgi:serine phosphatase RsbU (regulator of sigma subunit)
MGDVPSSEATMLNFGLDQRGPFLKIHAIHIFVRDQDESLRFYVDQLGFDLAFDATLQSGARWVAVAPPHGAAVLSLVAPAPDSREYQLIGRPTGIVFVTEDVIGKYQEWRRRGVQFLFTPRLRRVDFHHRAAHVSAATPSTTPEKQLTVWGGVFTRFKDVDGNTFELIGFDEVNREIEAQRRRNTEKLESERRVAQELEIARQVQARLFPQTLPHIGTLEYAGACIQARQVGGDYHDFLDLGQGRFGLVVADIAGKGIAAALLMANLQANLRSQTAIALDEPERLLRSVNRLFYENTNESAYATLFFAEYNDHTGLLRYANCGHLPALLLRRHCTIETLDSTCTVVGLFQDWNCSIRECWLGPGDTLVVYSDGITESFNDAGREFGGERLIEALQRCRELSAQDVIDSIVAEVREFSPREQHDDITLIVAKCRESRPPAGDLR